MPANLLESLAPGEPIRLRKDALLHLETRDWTFLALNKNILFLLSSEPQKSIREFKEEDIDWEAYQKVKDEIGLES